MTQSNLNKKELAIINAINDGGRATFATVIANVEQAMIKTSNPLRNAVITKLVNYKFLLNAVYENAVNNERKREQKEPNFKAKDNWHKKVYDSKNGAIVCNKNKNEDRYLSGIIQSAENLKYFVNGVEATEEQIAIIKQFKKKSNAPNKVIFRTIKISGIKEIRANKIKLQF